MTGRAGVVDISDRGALAAGASLDLRPRRIPALVLATLVAVLTMAVAEPASAASYGGVFGDNLTIAPAAPVLAMPSGVLAWGANGEGQLGDGTAVGPELCRGFSLLPCSKVPVPVSDLSGVTSVAAADGPGGRGRSLALLSNGTVMAWGDNRSGELGSGAPPPGPEQCPKEEGEGACSTAPVSVKALSGVTAISAGWQHSLALLTNGTVMAWGGNGDGQLGNGTTTESDVPVPVSGLSGVTAIAAAGSHSLALLSNGTVMAWGGNGNGQLGNSSTTNSDVPVAVSSLGGVTTIAGGGEHSLVRLSNGTVVAWGANGAGQLGNGSTTNSDVPVPVSGLSRVTAIAGGGGDSLALLTNGTVMAWGNNYSGELGDGTGGPEGGPEACGYGFSCSKVPVPVSGLSGVTAIAAGLALLTNGTVMAWGGNEYGELGNGTETNSDVPVAVSGLSGVTAIAAGGKHSLAVSAVPVVAEVEPSGGPFTGGTHVSITGINFTGATAVKFGSANAVRFRVKSASSITAVSPPGTGTVGVTVTNGTGTSPTGIDDRFSYEPIVTELQRTNGRPAGGTSLTITGTNLTGATAVRFGSANAVRFRVKSASSITAVSPAGTGTVNVTVTTPGGTSAISTADLFSYTTPREWTISPTPSLGAVENELDGISCVSSRFCMAVGHIGHWGAEALVEAWNGTAWSTLPAPPTPTRVFTASLSGVSCASARFCVAVGTYDVRGHTPDSSGPHSFIDAWNGTTWSQAKGAKGVDDKSALSGVSCVSSSFCLAVGGQDNELGGAPRTLVESWNGEMWSYVPKPSNAGPYSPSDLTSVSCVSSTFCVAVGKYLGTTLVESWNGTELSVVPSPNRGTGGNTLKDVSCVSAEHCVAVGAADGALVQSWNGSAWSLLESPSPEGSGLNGVSCVSVKSCVAVGGDETQGIVHTLVEASKRSGWSVVPSANGASGATELAGVSRVSTKSWFAVGKGEATPEGPFQTLVESGGI